MEYRKLGRLLAICLFSTCLSGPGEAQQAPSNRLPTTAKAWSEAALRDVEAGYRIYVDSHPGMYNVLDPGFPRRLQRARQRGLELARRTRDAAGFSATLDGFSAVLQDGHALLYADLPAAATPQRWPGFVAAWRGADLKVFGSTVPEIPVGAAVLSCDGRDVRSLVRANVFAFTPASDTPGAWWNRARYLFVDDGNPFVRPPARCRFSADGRIIETTLRWRPRDAQSRTWMADSVNGETLPPGLTEPRPKLLWFAMPTFQPDEATRVTYRATFDALRRRHQDVASADALVIDLRRNQGGSSSWSEDAARAIWGDAAVAAVLSRDTSRVWWRASAANTRYVRSLVAVLRDQGQADDAATIEKAAQGMEAALAANRRYWVEPPPATTPLASEPGPKFATPVYVIVPGQCASACLDALDIFSRLPNTKLIGAPSAADTDYMEVRVEDLPDGLAKIVIPNKLYRDRPRKSGETYKPAIEVDDLDWTTEAFRKVVEADLKR